jgi:hypothetical protein
MPTVSISMAKAGLCQERHRRVVGVGEVQVAATENDSGDDLATTTGTNARRLAANNRAGQIGSHDQREVA